MNCLAILDSGNYVFGLCRALEKRGYVFEVVSMPCHIATGGCGYCLKFPEECMGMVLDEARSNNFPVREIYRITPMFARNKYEKINRNNP